MLSPSIATLLSWANSVYLIAVAAAAVGSFGIYYLSGLYGEQKDRELDRFKIESQVQITAANTRALEARAEAAAAVERTARLEKATAEAQEREAEANERFAELNVRIAKFAEPRHFTPDQLLAISATCKAAVNIKIDFLAGTDDADALDLVEQLMEVFKESGWNVVSASGMIGNRVMGLTVSSTSAPPGITVVVPLDAQPNFAEAAKALVSEINKANIYSMIEIDSKKVLEQDRLHVIVGGRKL